MRTSTIQSKRPKLKKAAVAVFTAVFWLGVWQLAAVLIDQSIVLSPPLTVFETLFRLAGTGAFWLTVALSALRIFCGFALGVLAGVAFAVLTRVSRVAYTLFSPMMSVIRATPVASFIIMLLFFSENEYIPTVTAFLMVFPMIWANTFKGIEETDVKLIEMSKVFGLSRRAKLREIYLPSVEPYFVPAALSSLGFAWKAGVAAEVLAAPKYAVGGMLYRAKIYLETPEMLAWTICVIIISMLLEWLLSSLLRRRSAERSAAYDKA
ncbi:MAG: ABC transporter permease subunit [Clostridia bacterium]|nr:ABC transporter permease subunit [Clostridia bacterium]